MPAVPEPADPLATGGWFPPGMLQRVIAAAACGQVLTVAAKGHHRGVRAVAEAMLEPHRGRVPGAEQGASTARQDGLELFGVSRICERRGDATRARKLYEQSIASVLPVETDRTARRSLARLAKRDGDFALACDLWRSALGNSRPGYEAYEQLAIYHEHQARNPHEAREVVRQALDELRRANHAGTLAPRISRDPSEIRASNGSTGKKKQAASARRFGHETLPGRVSHMEEGRKRVLGIIAGILVARHLKTTEDLHDSRPSPADGGAGRVGSAVGRANHEKD